MRVRALDPLHSIIILAIIQHTIIVVKIFIIIPIIRFVHDRWRNDSNSS